jgi:hypothetical protein
LIFKKAKSWNMFIEKNKTDSEGLAHGPWEHGYEITNLHDYEPYGNALHLFYFVHGQREGENIEVENKY